MAPDTAEPTRLLFIGNSFTARNDVPRIVAELAADSESPPRIETSMIVAGGASLRRHWNAPHAREAIAANRWDFVVLQEQSTLPLKNAKRYHENVRLFDEAIRARGARTALYLTWSRRHVPGAQADITHAVRTIAEEIGALVVPVGVAWHEALRRDPALPLYADDGSHPTAAGSYLAACVFVATLFGSAPAGSSAADRLGLSREDAKAIHAAAMAAARSSGGPWAS